MNTFSYFKDNLNGILLIRWVPFNYHVFADGSSKTCIEDFCTKITVGYLLLNL